MNNPLTIEAGRTILWEGEPSAGFFILQSGAVEVVKEGETLAVLMYPGTIFGEIGPVLGQPRTCTVRARSAAEIVHVPFDDLDTVVREQPDTAALLLRTLASRLARTTAKLASVGVN